MAEYDFDLFVIGAGSGGVRAARIAAGHGARVGICEESRVGGTCVIRGCVPKKLLVYASQFSESFADAAGFGWQVGETQFDWAKLIAAKDQEIDRLNQVYLRLLENAGVSLFEGRGKLTDSHTVHVGERMIKAEKILIATGGRPYVPDFAGKEHVITSDEAFHLETLPQRIMVLGGGYIACEFAGIFNGLGADTTQVYRGDQILRGFDQDVRAAVAAGMQAKGVQLRLESNIQSVIRQQMGTPSDQNPRFRVLFTNGDEMETDLVMFATGRVPYTWDLGLETVGVELNSKNAILVDEYSRTSVDNIFAVGDVTDRINLTPVALHEGHAFADTEFAGKRRAVDHEYVPSAVFSQPPVGSVGLTEEQARERYTAVDIYRSSFRPMHYILAGREEQSMMKLIVDQDSQQVVGCHVVGPDAAEIVQGFAVAVKSRLTKAQWDATIGIHPTAAEELVTLRSPVAAD